MLPPRGALLVSVATGVVLELGTALATGRREAWDSGVYWSTGVPLAMVAAAAVGYLSGGTSWRSTLVIVPSQVATMMIRGGEAGNLWPLALLLSCFLSLPFALVAFVAAKLRLRT
jgi:hypothetical protein